jgi:hypothetical protein
MWPAGRCAALVLPLLLLPPRASAAELPIVDAHIHYSENSWQDYTPDAVLELLDRAGISRAFVSSTPDDGTLRLHARAPDRVVPVLRPYRLVGELVSWHRDPTVVPYLEQRLARPIYRGIGEFHLSGADAAAPVVRRVAELAAERGLFLHCHCDEPAAGILVGLVPGVRVLWAHAGMTAGPAEVGRMLDASPSLFVDLALRSDVAPGGQLDPAWRALFLRHPDRFLVGADTWVPSRFGALVATEAETRAWLAELPPDVARRLASENAERLAREAP